MDENSQSLECKLALKQIQAEKRELKLLIKQAELIQRQAEYTLDLSGEHLVHQQNLVFRSEGMVKKMEELSELSTQTSQKLMDYLTVETLRDFKRADFKWIIGGSVALVVIIMAMLIILRITQPTKTEPLPPAQLNELLPTPRFIEPERPTLIEPEKPIQEPMPSIELPPQSVEGELGETDVIE